MSTYESYEFQALDRPLTKQEQEELRALSSRATITPYRFSNFYTFGSFKGDPERLMERYFDAHVYTANWGDHLFMLRLPRRLFNPQRAAPYLMAKKQWGSGVSLRTVKDDVLLSLRWTQEDAWLEESEEEWLASLLLVREELLAGDLRALYLGWLARAASHELGDEDEEPPVPPGLRSLSAPLQALVDFLMLSPGLVAAAAEASPDLPSTSAASRGALLSWLRTLPAEQKDEALACFLEGTSPHLAAEWLQRFREAHAAAASPRASAARRTVGQLLQAAEAWEARLREQAERKKARARVAELDALAKREGAVWKEVESLFATQSGASHGKGVQLLVELRDLARHRGTEAKFRERLEGLRELNARRKALIRRLDAAGL